MSDQEKKPGTIPHHAPSILVIASEKRGVLSAPIMAAIRCEYGEEIITETVKWLVDGGFVKVSNGAVALTEKGWDQSKMITTVEVWRVCSGCGGNAPVEKDVFLEHNRADNGDVRCLASGQSAVGCAPVIE